MCKYVYFFLSQNILLSLCASIYKENIRFPININFSYAVIVINMSISSINYRRCNLIRDIASDETIFPFKDTLMTP